MPNHLNELRFLLMLIVVAVLLDVPLAGRLTARSAEQGRYDREFAEIVASYE